MHTCNRRYCNYSAGDFDVFRAAGTTRFTGYREILHGGGDRSFTQIRKYLGFPAKKTRKNAKIANFFAPQEQTPYSMLVKSVGFLRIIGLQKLTFGAIRLINEKFIDKKRDGGFSSGSDWKKSKGCKNGTDILYFHAKFGTAVLYFVVLAYTAQQCVVIVWRENFNPKPSIKTRDTKAKRSYIYTVAHKKHIKMCFAITFVKLDGYWTNLADCFLNKFYIKRCKQMSPEPSTSFILSAETCKSLIQLQRMAILLNATSSCHWTKMWNLNVIQ